MKKIFVLIIAFLLNQNFLYADTSTNIFEVEIKNKDIPENNEYIKKNNGGLSDGAITAITLGSIGGVLLGAIGIVGYKKYLSNGLKQNCCYGDKNPIIGMCLDKEKVKEFNIKYKNHILLNEILLQEEIRECPNSKYILIPDSKLKNKSFDTYIFEFPKDLKKVRITQNSSQGKKSISIDLYSDKNKITLKKIKNKNNITTYESEEINPNTGTLVVKYEDLKEIYENDYAILIEFFR